MPFNLLIPLTLFLYLGGFITINPIRIFSKQEKSILDKVEKTILDKNYNNGLKVLTDLEDKKNLSARFYFLKARIQQENKDNLNALINYSIAIEKDTEFYKAFNNRGLVKGSLKDLKGALEDFSKAIILNEDFEAAYINRGVTYSALKRPSKAISDFTKAIEINPESIEAYTNRAITYRFMKSYRRLCLDLQIIKKLGGQQVEDWIKEYCE